MKKVIALMMAAIMCLGLSACTSDSEVEALKSELKASQEKLAEYEDYDQLIGYLKVENYEAALADIEARMPIPTEPKHTDIEISIDNWDQYFELRPTIVVVEDSFEEITVVSEHYGIFLKEAYKDKYLNGNVSFKIEYDHVCKHIDIDGNSYELGDIVYHGDKKLSQTGALRDYRGKEYTESWLEDSNSRMISDFSDEVVCVMQPVQTVGVSEAIQSMDAGSVIGAEGSISLTE